MRGVATLVGCLALLVAGAPRAQQAGPVPALSTGVLASFCAATGTDAEATLARGYCRGFLIGAGQYHAAVSQPGELAPIFCLPNPSPPIEAAQASFVAWAGANPALADTRAVEGVLRWAQATFPCPAAATGRRR